MEPPLSNVFDSDDWAFVVRDGCAECGFEPVSPDRVPGRIRETIPGWWDALHRADARVRPSAERWSPLEYGCHVVDICAAFADRLARVLERDGAECPNFDGEAAAIERDYASRDPEQVADEFERVAERTAQGFIAITAPQWNRRGRRSDGVTFTVASMANHFLHELEHHLHDVAPTRSH